MNPPDNLPAPDKPFLEPWHAQVFALTHRLAQGGHFTWNEWAARFAAQRAASAGDGAPDTETSYYLDWLTAFEQLLFEKDLASPSVQASLKQAWTKAYIDTPHGKPVELPI